VSANIIDPGHPAAAERDALRFRERVAETARQMAVQRTTWVQDQCCYTDPWIDECVKTAEGVERYLRDYVKGGAK
jgi:hypothetical protein